MINMMSPFRIRLLYSRVTLCPYNMGLLVNRPPFSDMRSLQELKRNNFLTAHIYKHNKLPNKNGSDEIKLVCRIFSNLFCTFGIKLVCNA
jgi:hypothetical protein